MGCCFAKEQLPIIDKEAQALSADEQQNQDYSDVRQPTMSEKRRRAAEAAETRQADWRQGGSKDAEKAQNLKMRREKDELLGKIYAKYHTLGKEAPIGLPSCDLEQLRKHLDKLQ
jgi:predicted DNA binding CopG/RHH family protein